MAAVTQLSTAPPTRHVLGDLVSRTFTISGASGSTLNTNMLGIVTYIVQQSTAAGSISLITAVAVSGSTLTFTSSSTMVNEVVTVLALKG